SRSNAGPRGVGARPTVTEVPDIRGLLPCRADGLRAEGEGMTRVLVAYATKMNGTKGIAEAIGAELTARGLKVEVRNVREADSPDHSDAVGWGSASTAARWRPEAKHGVNQHAGEWARHPVWLFESGGVGKKPPSLSPTPGGRKRATRIGA